MAPLTVAGLRKRYGAIEVLAGVSFEIARGKCFGLLGPNGAGKTTTLRCVLGLTPPAAGEIRLCGEPVPARAREARIRVGVVPQVDNLDPDFSVAENLLVYGRYFGLPERVIRSRIPPLLEFAGLAGRAATGIRELSGGMKRRLALARALINEPELLVLDEPTTGLDPQARHLIWDRLMALPKRGVTVLLTTHFMEEAERLCHDIAILDHGRVIARGPARELIAAHIEPQVVEVYGEGAREWAQAHASGLSARVETAGETVFCYLSDATTLLAHLEGQAGLRYLHRPADLEDVFLKLTGRELRE